MTSHFQYQPFDKWYINFRHSYGIASTYFYSPDRNEEVWDKKILGSGTSSASALGARFIFDPGLSNQFSIGLDLRYSYTKIGKINDPQNILLPNLNSPETIDLMAILQGITNYLF